VVALQVYTDSPAFVDRILSELPLVSIAVRCGDPRGVVGNTARGLSLHVSPSSRSSTPIR
jgi:hypothetical protein